MNEYRKVDMDKATRLTRAGKLKEALAVLRGAFGGLGRPSAAAPAVPPAVAMPDLGLGVPEAVRGLLDRLGVGGRDSRPETAGFSERVFTNQAGSRKYKLFVPRGYHGQALPLVVMLHGCTQSPDDFAAGTRMNELAEAENFFVVYPAQSKSANFQKCWNWFNAADQHRDTGEPSLIAGITHAVMAEYAVKPRQIYVAGMSAGGAAAMIMAANYPDLYAAVGVHSGLACGAATNMGAAFGAMQRGAPAEAVAAHKVSVPVIVFQGDQDGTVNAVNGDQVIAQAEPADAVRTTVVEGETNGRFYTRTVQEDARGRPVVEKWLVHGAGHAWSGGSAAGSFSDPQGPDASREMLRFFLRQERRG